MHQEQIRVGEISIPLLIKSLREKGWVMLPPHPNGIGRMRTITELLCRSILPSTGRESYGEKFPEGDFYHAPFGRKAVLGHSERAHAPSGPVPDLCFFLSISSTPLENGGHLTVADGERILDILPTELVNRLRQEGVSYQMKWEPKRWEEEFQHRSIQELTAWMANHPDITHQWDGNNLLLSWRTCALRRSWTSGREAFANGILAHLPEIPHEINDANNIFCRSSNGVSWRDGSSLTKPEIMAMIHAHEHSLQIVPMQPGQMIIIDNTRTLHGRTAAAQDVGRELVCRFGLRAAHL